MPRWCLYVDLLLLFILPLLFPWLVVGWFAAAVAFGGAEAVVLGCCCGCGVVWEEKTLLILSLGSLQYVAFQRHFDADWGESLDDLPTLSGRLVRVHMNEPVDGHMHKEEHEGTVSLEGYIV